MTKMPDNQACKKGNQPLPALRPIVCVKSLLCGYPSPGKTVYTVCLRPNGPLNTDMKLAESGDADVKA